MNFNSTREQTKQCSYAETERSNHKPDIIVFLRRNRKVKSQITDISQIKVCFEAWSSYIKKQQQIDGIANVRRQRRAARWIKLYHGLFF
jgi:hypothetical protein